MSGHNYKEIPEIKELETGVNYDVQSSYFRALRAKACWLLADPSYSTHKADSHILLCDISLMNGIGKKDTAVRRRRLQFNADAWQLAITLQHIHDILLAL